MLAKPAYKKCDVQYYKSLTVETQHINKCFFSTVSTDRLIIQINSNQYLDFVKIKKTLPKYLNIVIDLWDDYKLEKLEQKDVRNLEFIRFRLFYKVFVLKGEGEGGQERILKNLENSIQSLYKAKHILLYYYFLLLSSISP